MVVPLRLGSPSFVIIYSQMSCQSNDVDGLRSLQTELMAKLDQDQNELVHKIVELYLNK